MVYKSGSIGPDSIGAMGAIAPTAKNLRGDAPKSPHRNFVMSLLYTAKRCRHYECEKCALISA